MQRVFGNLDALRYVDNRLDEERKAAFLAHLAADPQDAERVALWARQNDVIRAAFASLSLEPVPLWLRLGQMGVDRGSTPQPVPDAARPALTPALGPVARVTDLPRTPSLAGPPMQAVPPAREAASRRPSLSLGTSAAALLVVGLLILYVARGLLLAPSGLDDGAPDVLPPTRAMVTRAVDAYRTYAVDPVRPVEIAAAQAAQLDHWLMRRLATPVHAPDLHADGWTLLGGRLVPGDSGPGAYFIYESDTGDRLGVYVTVGDASVGPDLALDAMTGGGATMAWLSGQTGYVVTTGRSVDWLSRNADALKLRIARSSGAN